MFNELNKRKKWDKETKDFDFMKLREYLDIHGMDCTIRVWGYYINQLDNGKACTIITDDVMINMPSHAVEWFSNMSAENDAAINEGKLLLKNFKELETKFKNKTIVYDYCDAE